MEATTTTNAVAGKASGRCENGRDDPGGDAEERRVDRKLDNVGGAAIRGKVVDATSDSVFKTNSRGDGQNLKAVDAGCEARSVSSKADAREEATDAAMEEGRSNSDDEATSRKKSASSTTTSLRNATQSEMQFVAEKGNGERKFNEMGQKAEEVRNEGKEQIARDTSPAHFDSSTSTSNDGFGGPTRENDDDEDCSTTPVIRSVHSRATDDEENFWQPAVESSSSSRSPYLSDEEYEAYLPEAVEEAATVFGQSQSASPASSEQSLVVSPVVETASTPPSETAELFSYVREALSVWNKNDDARFVDDGDEPKNAARAEEEDGISSRNSSFDGGAGQNQRLIGESVAKIIARQSVGQSAFQRANESVYMDQSDASSLTATPSSLTIQSSSDELDFDEEMQIRELLALQEGVVAAEAALAAAEEATDDEQESSSLCESWGRNCLFCFRRTL